MSPSILARNSLLVFVLLTARLLAGSDLSQVGDIPLPDLHGPIAAVVADDSRQQVFLAAGDRVAKLGSQQWLEVSARGLAVDANTGHLFVSGQDALRIFDGERLLMQVDGLSQAADVCYDARLQRVYVSYGEGGLAQVDGVTGRRHPDLTLAAVRPDTVILGNHRLYATFVGDRIIEVYNPAERKVESRWSVPRFGLGRGLALDPEHHRLFVPSVSPPALLALDTDSGRVVDELDGIAAGAQSIVVAEDIHRIYVLGRDGQLSVIHQGLASLSLVETVPTSQQAAGCVWTQGRLYVPCQGTPPHVLVYQP